MDRFRPRYFKYDKYKNLNSFIEYHQTENHKSIVSLSDVRNGWPYDYHNSFWENYYRNYANETYDFDFSTGWSFPTGPRYKTWNIPWKQSEREESYLWNHEALLSPACPPCYRASVYAYKDYPRCKVETCFCFSLTPWDGTYLIIHLEKRLDQKLKNAKMLPLFQDSCNLLKDTTLVVRRANRGLTHYMALARGMSDLYYWGFFNLFLFELLPTWEYKGNSGMGLREVIYLKVNNGLGLLPE